MIRGYILRGTSNNEEKQITRPLDGCRDIVTGEVGKEQRILTEEHFSFVDLRDRTAISVS